MAKRGRPKRQVEQQFVRFQTNIDSEVYESFTAVKHGLRAASHTEALRMMIRLAAWYVREVDAGATVVVRKNGTEREVELLL